MKKKTTRSPPPKNSPAADRVLAYARDVVAGRIVAGWPVRLACARHIDDLEHGPARGLVWRPERAESAFTFIERAVNIDEGKPFALEPFQAFIVGSIFGWYRTDGCRRFRTAYVEIGKGNGKTPLAAVIGLYGFVIDREQAPEIYSAATAKEQAAIAFKDASRMVDLSPHLKKRISTQKGNLAIPARHAVFRPVSSEHRGLDGKRVHVAIIDELHEHPSPMVVDKMRAGTKNRRNAIIFEITNSGTHRHSVCRAHHDYSLRILEGATRPAGIKNDAWFAYVCSLDPCPKCRAAGREQPSDECPACDQWKDPATWPKANPGLGTILPASYLREQVTEATDMVSKQNIVKRLNFCLWTEQVTRWLNMERWDACAAPFDPAILHGRTCMGGLDLASTGDLAAYVETFVPFDEFTYIVPHFFMPENNVRRRDESTDVPYAEWARRGLIHLTPGDVIDYDYIRAHIAARSQLHPVKEIGYDPWNATETATQLQNQGFKPVPIRQGYGSMSEPSKALEKRVLSRTLRHGGHPVLRWMATNAAIASDPAGNIKPDKEKSGEKIDGITALVNSLARLIVTATPKKSVYETRGVRTL